MEYDENSTIEAYGDAKRFVEFVFPGDIVFYSHKLCGIVAAAKVKRGNIIKPDDETYAREVEFLTPIPTKDKPINAMPFKKVSEITGKSFFWARTLKVPYLSSNEADSLVKELNAFFAETVVNT